MLQQPCVCCCVPLLVTVAALLMPAPPSTVCFHPRPGAPLAAPPSPLCTLTVSLSPPLLASHPSPARLQAAGTAAGRAAHTVSGCRRPRQRACPGRRGRCPGSQVQGQGGLPLAAWHTGRGWVWGAHPHIYTRFYAAFKVVSHVYKRAHAHAALLWALGMTWPCRLRLCCGVCRYGPDWRTPRYASKGADQLEHSKRYLRLLRALGRVGLRI